MLKIKGMSAIRFNLNGSRSSLDGRHLRQTPMPAISFSRIEFPTQETPETFGFQPV
jgi:hypothetical protein